MSAVQIQALVRNMDESLRRHKGLKKTNKVIWRQKIEEENQKLFNDYPTVYEMHLEGKLDETFFYMLQMRRKIEKGELTEDEASKIVGQKLFDRFVGPVVGNTPPPQPMLSYADYYKQFSEEK